MSTDHTEEQQMLRDMIAGFLADRYDHDARVAAIRSDLGRDPGLWQAFAGELAFLGAGFDEALGGFGGGYPETMLIMQELGAALAAEPYLGTVVIGGGFLRRAAPAFAAEWIGRIIAGEALIAFAQAEPQGRYNLADIRTTARRDGAGWVLNGFKSVVVGAPWASHLIVTARTGGSQREAGGVSVFLVERDAPGISRLDYATIDGHRAADITFENVALPAEALIGEEGGALPLVEQVVDEATVAVAAEACGVLRRLHADTVDYTRQRKQFGVPIASFQVLQHRMVDMFIHLERTVSMTAMATAALAQPADERARTVSATKVQVGQACRYVAQNAVQLHGGIGITDELALGHYFKRATVIENQFGSVDHHLTRFERLTYGAAA